MNSSLADELFVHLATPDRREAARYSASLVAGGLDLQALVDEGIAPAMRQVGALWEAAVWTVVDEHLATAAAEAALTSAAYNQPSAGTKGELVVACVEGDWHSLPARMVAEVLLGHGWSVRFLGASQPTAPLVEYAARNRPNAVLLSCAVPMALPALAGAVGALHTLDLPVIVGGRALTTGRAAAVGADGYSTSASGAVTLLGGPLLKTALGPATALLPLYRARVALFPSWLKAGMAALAELMPSVGDLPEDIRVRTGEDLRHLLDVACIGLLLDDERLVDEQCDWMLRVLIARGVAEQALIHGLTALVRTRPREPDAVAVGAVLQQQRKRLLAEGLRA